MKETNQKIINIPEKKFRENIWDYVGEWILSQSYDAQEDKIYFEYEIKTVKVVEKGVDFVFGFRIPNTNKYCELKPAELIDKLERELKAVTDRLKKGEITSMETLDLQKELTKDFGIHAFQLEEEYIFKMLYSMKYPSFLGSFYKPEAWVAWTTPGAGEKITKVEFIDDGVEFTIVKL